MNKELLPISEPLTINSLPMREIISSVNEHYLENVLHFSMQ